MREKYDEEFEVEGRRGGRKKQVEGENKRMKFEVEERKKWNKLRLKKGKRGRKLRLSEKCDEGIEGKEMEQKMKGDTRIRKLKLKKHRSIETS